MASSMKERVLEQPWGRVVEDSSRLHFIEVSVDQPEFPYPAMVQVEWEGGTILAHDARAYALALLAAAEIADQRNEAAAVHATEEVAP